MELHTPPSATGEPQLAPPPDEAPLEPDEPLDVLPLDPPVLDPPDDDPDDDPPDDDPPESGLGAAASSDPAGVLELELQPSAASVAATAVTIQGRAIPTFVAIGRP